jgi:predicted TIM-barrel enzyme
MAALTTQSYMFLSTAAASLLGNTALQEANDSVEDSSERVVLKFADLPHEQR